MVCIVIGAIIGLVAGLALSIDEGAGPIGGFFTALLSGAMGGALALVFAMLLSLPAPLPVVTTQSKTPLESIQDGQQTRGQFFLGSGTINDVSVFTWYEESSDNAYRQRQADASASTVHYVPSGTRPYYTRTVRKRTGSFFGTWVTHPETGEVKSDEYDFYVPEGTVRQNYELDAK